MAYGLVPSPLIVDANDDGEAVSHPAELVRGDFLLCASEGPLIRSFVPEARLRHDGHLLPRGEKGLVAVLESFLMPSASFSLQQSIFSTLAADTALTALLGGPRVYDDVPQGTGFPYLTFGLTTARDWSTGGDPAAEDGTEHSFTLHVWSDGRGKKQAHEILAAVRTALHDQPLALVGHRLVNLRHEVSETRRDPDGQTIHGTARFRAVTEPA